MANKTTNDKLSSLLDKKLAEVKPEPAKKRSSKPSAGSKQLKVAASRRRGLKNGELRTTIIVQEEQMAMFQKIWYMKASEASALNPVKIKDMYEEMFGHYIDKYASKLKSFEKEHGPIPADFNMK